MKPSEQEPCCPITFEMTRVLVGGTPDSRPGFWKKYRDNLEHNRKTGYRNQRIQIIADHLRALKLKPGATYYYRHGQLIPEKELA